MPSRLNSFGSVLLLWLLISAVAGDSVAKLFSQIRYSGQASSEGAFDLAAERLQSTGTFSADMDAIMGMIADDGR